MFLGWKTFRTRVLQCCQFFHQLFSVAQVMCHAAVILFYFLNGSITLYQLNNRSGPSCTREGRRYNIISIDLRARKYFFPVLEVIAKRQFPAMEEEGIGRNAAAPAIPVAAVEEGGVIVNAGEEEISDDIYYLRPEDAGIILSHTDPGRMKITRQEHRLALAIREAIAASPDIDPISDMMCAQLAMIEGENIEAALERAEQLQAFREEYGVQDTAEDGIRLFARLNSLFPCFHLCLSYNHDGGNYVMIYDMTKFDLRLLKTEEQINIWLGGSYYSQAALFPDLEAIRRGAILINELEGCATLVI